MRNWKTSFVTWWLALTPVYIALFFLLKGDFPQITYALGLFVPYGVANGFMLAASVQDPTLFPILAFILFVFALLSADYVAFWLGIRSAFLKIVFNLVVLALLTLLVDLATWGKWSSMMLLLGFKVTP